MSAMNEKIATFADVLRVQDAEIPERVAMRASCWPARTSSTTCPR